MNTETPPTITQPRSYGEVVRNLAFIAIAIGAAYVVTVFIGVESLRTLVASAGIFGPIAVVLLKATTIIVVPLGGTPIYVIAGAAFGFWKGLLLVVMGDFVGFSVAFYLSRFFGRSIVSFFVPLAQVATIENILAKSGTLSALLKVRLALVAIPELFAYGAGLTAASFPVFIVIQMIPHLPSVTLYVFFGDTLLHLSGSVVYVAIVTAFSIIAGIVGGWWFHRDVIRES